MIAKVISSDLINRKTTKTKQKNDKLNKMIKDHKREDRCC